MMNDMILNQIEIIPAIDLLDGEIVRLYKGDYNKKKVYSNDILKLVFNYVNQGAQFLHLVDLNGAKDPEFRQINLISKIIKETKIKIQVGGGIRTQEDIKRLLDVGSNRVVIGSSVINYPSEVKDWFKIFGSDKLILSLDINIDSNNNKKVAIHGWQQESSRTLENVIDDFLEVGLKYVLCTDISRDGTMLGSNINLYREICNKYPNIYFQASGGVNSLNDIKLLKSSKVKGLIIGKALLEGEFTFEEILSQC